MRIHLLFGLLLLMGLLSCHSTEVQHRAPLPKAIVTEELLVTLPSPYNDLIPLERGIRTVGDRYAIIYKKDSVTSILNMSGVEIEGDFETFHTPSFGCGFGYDQKYQDSTRFLRVEADRSLCTFIITDKQGEIHTYIDGEKVDNALSKSYAIQQFGNYNDVVDTTSYTLSKRKRRVNDKGVQYISWEKTSNFYNRGVMSPDFQEIKYVRFDTITKSYSYHASYYGEREEYVVFGDSIIRGYPYSSYGAGQNIRNSRFGDQCIRYGTKQGSGYWVNGVAYPSDGKPMDIIFSGAEKFKYISKVADNEYYWVTQEGKSKAFQFLDAFSVHDRYVRNGTIELTRDSIHGYVLDKKVLSISHSFKEGFRDAQFERSEDEQKIAVKVRLQDGQQYFHINNRWHEATVVDGSAAYISSKYTYTAKFAGFSKTGGHYAYQKNLYNDSTSQVMWVNIFVDDTLLGKYPPGSEFHWLLTDSFQVTSKFSEKIRYRNSKFESNQKKYQEFADKYYPEGLPEYLFEVRYPETSAGTKQLRNGEWYLKDGRIITMRNRMVNTFGQQPFFGLLENDSIYYTRKASADRTFIYMDFNLVYASDEILGLTSEGNTLKFYAYNADKFRRVSLKMPYY